LVKSSNLGKKKKERKKEAEQREEEEGEEAEAHSAKFFSNFTTDFLEQGL
jgi:hypothetical protein